MSGPFIALFTERTNDNDADLFCVLANREDELTDEAVKCLAESLEVEGETVHIKHFDRLADIPDVLELEAA